MLRISGTKISLTRGDSAYINLTIYDQEGQVYEPDSDDIVRCQVRTAPNTGDLLIDGDVEIQNDNIVWHIKPEDTENYDVGKYYWDAELETAEGDVFTFITSSIFKLTDEVTMDG